MYAAKKWEHNLKASEKHTVEPLSSHSHISSQRRPF